MSPWDNDNCLHADTCHPGHAGGCDIHLPHDYHVVCNVGDDDADDHETNHVYCHKNVLQVLTFFPSHKSKQLTKSHNPKAEADTCGRLIIPSATAGTTSQPPPRVANNSILSLSIYTGLARGATIRSGATPAAVAHHRGQRCRTIGTMAAGTKSCQRYDRCWCCRRRPL